MKLALYALLCALAWHTPALAQNAKPIELRWDAPDGCPNSDAVLERLRQIAGPSYATDTRLVAEATVTQPHEGLFHLRLVIRAGNLVGVRNVDGKSCRDLADVTALWLAVLLSSGEPLNERALSGPQTSELPGEPPAPSGTQRPGQETAPSPSSKTAPSSPTPRPPPAESKTGARSSRRLHGLLTLPLAAISIGPLQRESQGLGLAAGVSVEHWRLLAEGTFWLPQRATTTYLLDEYTADLSRLSIGLRGCRSVWGSSRFELAPCLLVSLQRLTARGDGPSLASRTPNTTWVAAGAGVQARLFIAPWLGLVAGIDGELETSRPEVDLQGIGEVERLSPAAATITIGAEWIL